MNLYAALSVPEVWRYYGSSLMIYQLQSGSCWECDRSPTFSFIHPASLLQFLQARKTGETNFIRLLREWIKN